MSNTDPRIDAYIDKSAPFAQPILLHLRKLVHEACPEVQETMKWSMPHFDYKGLLCGMASFKQHCTFGFWKASLMSDAAKLADNRENGGMGSFGKITSLDDLPSDDQMREYIREAARLNEEGVKRPSPPVSKEKKELIIPGDLAAELARNEAARTNFENFSYSKKKEYVEWITEAKTEPTRLKRLATTIEWLAEGKARNWKYEKC